MKDNCMSAPAAVADWRAQAERDAGGKKIAVIAHRWNNGPWWCGLCLPGLPVIWLRADAFLAAPLSIIERLT
ncbi:hypothetical protein [Deinococcus marmoris]|uniref:Uncharacterized protein n=1 Tax=Deinococcus marmoris TaxID=249408 RepID=A0A1U7P322_9DEIO|nr:hypothetical protein [Deinococcus marmoris]OLV19556.1 hypothetical protein BOO71_0002407 [Deinococcus marmoris]